MGEEPASPVPEKPEKPITGSVATPTIPSEPAVHLGHKAGAWIVTCFADPPRAWLQLEKGLKSVKGGHWIKTLIGISVAAVFFWWVFFRSSDGPSYSANNNTNSDVIQGSPNAVIDKSVHNEAQSPMAGTINRANPHDMYPEYLSLGGARFFFANSNGVVFTDQGEPILTAKTAGDRLLVSAEIRDKNGDLIAELSENEWKLNPGLIFDRNYSNLAVEVRDRAGNVVLQVVNCGQVVRFEGLFHLKNGNFVSVGRDENDIPALTLNRPIKINRIFTYPSELHLGECPGYDAVVKSEPPIISGQPFGYMISGPIEVGTKPPSSTPDKSASRH